MTFFVPGIPRTKGNWKAVRHPRTGKALLVPKSRKSMPWEQAVAWDAKQAWPGTPTAAPVDLRLAFWFPRPASHKKKGGALRKGFSVLPIGHNVGDLDKLVRAVMDAFTGVIYEDDSQVYRCEATKQYVDSRPCVVSGVGVTVLLWKG